MQLPARQPANERPQSRPPLPQNNPQPRKIRDGRWPHQEPHYLNTPTPEPSQAGLIPPSKARHQAHSAYPPQHQQPFSNPFAVPGLQPANVKSHINKSYTFERFIEG